MADRRAVGMQVTDPGCVRICDSKDPETTNPHRQGSDEMIGVTSAQSHASVKKNVLDLHSLLWHSFQIYHKE